MKTSGLLLSLLILTLGLASSDVHGQSLNGAFDDVIDQSQEKMVKVFGAGAGRVESYATGMIVSSEGLILTRQGVFLEGNQVRVITSDGKIHSASVLRRNREIQVALLKIEAKTPEYFELSAKPVGKKGDWVLALNNAFRVADKKEPVSVTVGVISLRSTIDARLNLKDIAYRGPIVLIDCITSNPGAAGGAVVNESGKLVGMLGRIIKSSDTNTRLNYAVPSTVLKKFVENQLQENTTVVDSGKSAKPADLGIRLMKFGGKRDPAYVDRVIRKSPAQDVGIRPDDLIVSLNGVSIKTIRDFETAMKGIEPGKEVIIIYRQPGSDQIIRVPIKAVEKK